MTIAELTQRLDAQAAAMARNDFVFGHDDDGVIYVVDRAPRIANGLDIIEPLTSADLKETLQ